MIFGLLGQSLCDKNSDSRGADHVTGNGSRRPIPTGVRQSDGSRRTRPRPTGTRPNRGSRFTRTTQTSTSSNAF